MQANKDLSTKMQLPLWKGKIVDVYPCIDLVAYIPKLFEEWVSSYEEIYGAFLDEFGSQFTHCDKGTGKSLKATRNQLTKYLQWKDDPKFFKRPLISFEASSGAHYSHPTPPRFKFFQSQIPGDNTSGYIQLSFPLNYDANKILDFIKKHFKDLVLSAGYCGYSVLCDDSTYWNSTWEGSFLEFLNKYPGLNHPAADRIASWSEDRLLVIGWLTFLGKNLIKEMGGVKKIKKDLGKDFIFHSLGNSLCIQAGEEPQLGANGADSLPLYQKLGKYLNPIRLSDKIIENGLGFFEYGAPGEKPTRIGSNWHLRFFK